MTTPRLQLDDPAILAWSAFTLLALGLALFVPPWVVSFCVPAAGMTGWLLHRRRAARDIARLERVVGVIGSIGRAGASSMPKDAEEPTEPAFEPDPIDRLEGAARHREGRLSRVLARVFESRALLRATLNAVDAPVIATDEAARVWFLNRSGERLLSRPPGRGLGVPLEDLFSSSALLELHARAERGEACRDRIRLALNGQPRFYEVFATPIRLDIADIPPHASQRAGVVLTLRDVHDLAQTLQLRTDFVANASHELRTPIASLRAAIETMRDHAGDDPVMRARLVGMLDANIARLEEMINDLLDLSSLESEEQAVRDEPFDALEMGESLQAMFETACRKRSLTLVFELDPRLRRMRSDRTLLLLILRNLIDNATKFAFENTAIRVRGEIISAGPASPAGARFSVADRGVGIPLRHQERIFERFYQVDESRARVGTRRGSGLGLAIVRHALRRLDGQIAVESVWQEGTTMIVTIPRCVDDSPA